MARPVTKGKKNWKVPFAISLTPEVIKWLKSKATGTKSTSHFANELLEKAMIEEIEGEF